LQGAWLPAWFFEVATLVRGEEVLLAVGFVFTIHIFNGHVRPEKFPMDPVTFTGGTSEHGLKDERPQEYERLVREGRLAAMEATPTAAGAMTFDGVISGTTLVLGIVTIPLILFGRLVG
jgi:hypothetical protein